MGSVIQVLSYTYLQKNAGTDAGGPLAVGVAEGIPVSKILAIEADTSVAGCNSRLTVKTNGNVPDIYWGAATVAATLSTINTTA